MKIPVLGIGTRPSAAACHHVPVSYHYLAATMPSCPPPPLPAVHCRSHNALPSADLRRPTTAHHWPETEPPGLGDGPKAAVSRLVYRRTASLKPHYRMKWEVTIIYIYICVYKY